MNHCLHVLYHLECSYLSIQFNSNKLFKNGDPVSLKLIFPGAIQICEHYNTFYAYIQNNTGLSDKHRQTQLTLHTKTYP